MRIGIGYDVHPFREGRRLVLGGVAMDHDRGLDGHSDADALIHAVSDAILGALGEGDIGVHFPDSDPALEGLDSGRILGRAVELARERGYRVVNVDAVVKTEEPKIAPYREAMRANLAAILGVVAGSVSIKGKRGEGLGFVGRGEGIEVYAVALLAEDSGR